MAKLALWFTADKEITLEKTIFFHAPLGSELRAVRGRTAGAYQGYNTFQWTPAVQAMAQLVLKTAALRSDGSNAEAILEGYENSPASSLDYAINKAPSWLLDVFGVDKTGLVIAKRVFSRTNPNRKRCGPTAVAINENLLHRSNINIFVNGEAIKEAPILKELAQAVEKAYYEQRNKEKCVSPTAKTSQLKTTVLTLQKKQSNNIGSKPHEQTDTSTSAKTAGICCPYCSSLFHVAVLSPKAA